MNEQTPTQQNNPDEISLKELILIAKDWTSYLWGRKWLFILVGCLGGAIGFAYSKYLTKPEYTAKITFAMEQKSGGAASALGGLASSLGIGDIGGASSSGMFGGENILMLMKSNRIIHEALKAPLDELKGDHLLNAYVKNHFDKELKEKKIALFPKTFDSITSTRAQDSLLLLITKNIREKQLIAERADKKTTIINLEVKDQNEQWALLFSKMLVQHAIDLYMEIKVGKLISTERELTRKRDSIRGLLDGSITTLAIETDLNSHAPLMRYKTKQAKKQVDVEVLKTMYGNVIQNLEMTKFQRSQEEPIIEIIDEPILPLEMEYFTKSKGVVLFGILAVGVYLSLIIIRKIIKDVLL
jgi:Chain length determinant protein